MKVRCTIAKSDRYVKGNIYNVENGVMTDEHDYKCRCGNTLLDINHLLDSQFEEVKEMTKDDLKVGYLVELRKGKLCIVIPVKHNLALYSNDQAVECYLSDLNNECNDKDGDYEFDVIKIFGLSTTCDLFDISGRDLLWQREEPVKEVTIADIEKQFGCKVKIVKE